MPSFLASVFGSLASPGLDIELAGNRNALSLLIFTEHVNATYFISFDLPLRRLHHAGEVNFSVVSQARMRGIDARHVDAVLERWRKRVLPHVVFLSRYAGPHGAEILNYFKSRNVPVIYHIDDDLLDVPEFLGTEIRRRQGASEVVNTRERLLRDADLVYASTERLAQVLRRRLQGQRVIHGAVYAPYLGDHLADVQTQPRASGAPVIGYMGSKGHQADLELVAPAIEQLLEERSGLRFEVFGTIGLPPALCRFGERVRAHPVKRTYLEFLATLKSLNWTIGLAPLANAPFNLCKAPTKFIEYSACGIPTVASNIGVYEGSAPASAIILVNGDWHGALAALLDAPARRKSMILEAQKHCAAAFSMKELEKQLLKISSETKAR